ncbi:MAG: MBL fold metallo-hydrolase [Gammaproteobacteria bacterium]|nr:MBL fold metallo-hydrolase [Gammaproteobacteria bacterium]
MKKRELTVVIISIACLTACGIDRSQMPANASEVEILISQYYNDIAAYDYAAMRAVYTPDFEILDDGRRLDSAGFEELVRGLEARGLTWQFDLSEFNTEVAPDIAYTTYVITSPPDRKWFGAATLKRSEETWSVDRMVMMGEAEITVAQQASDGPGEPEYRITHISGDLYRFQHGGHYNVFLVTSEGIIMTDPSAQFDDRAVLWLKGQFAERFGVPVRYVVYSHHHLDHVAGGDVFADTAEFIGHENMLEKFEPPAANQSLAPFFASLDRDNDDRLVVDEAGPLGPLFDDWDANTDGYLNGAEIAARVVDRVRRPDTVYAESMTIELGGKTVELVYTGPNYHSDDMSVVYFPEERVVYGADLLGAFTGLPDGSFSGSSMRDWISSLRVVEALDFDIVAPGHGPMARKADVTLARRSWEDLHAAVAAGIARGRSIAELQRTIRLDDYRYYPQYEERLSSSISEAYRAIVAHDVDAAPGGG